MKGLTSGALNAEASLQTLSKAVEHSGDGVMITDIQRNILYVNATLLKITGYKRSEIIGKTPSLLRSGEHPGDFYRKKWDILSSGRKFKSTTINKTKSGELLYVDQTISSVKNREGKIIYFVLVLKDVGERIKFEKNLKDLNDHLTFEKYKLEQILSYDEQVYTISKLDHLIDFIVQKASKILDSKRCSLLLKSDDSDELCIKGAVGIKEKVIKEWRTTLGEGVSGKVAKEGKPLLVKDIRSDKRFNRKNNTIYSSYSFLSVPIKLENKIIGVLNVTERSPARGLEYNELDLKILMAIVRQAAIAIENARISKELKYLTITDPLTKLYNFRYFTESLDNEIKRARRTLRPLSLLMIDIDDFNSYNHDFGLEEGDSLLKVIGQNLKMHIREIDIVCRYAGDEFVIILPETNIQQARIVARRILSLSKKLNVKRSVSLSLGLAGYKKPLVRRELVLRADQALYKAKKEGKNKVCSIPV